MKYYNPIDKLIIACKTTLNDEGKSGTRGMVASRIAMTSLLQGSSVMPTNIRQRNWMYKMTITAETPRYTAAVASTPRFTAMFWTDYQHAIAVSIGGMTSKQLTDNNNVTNVSRTAFHAPEGSDVSKICIQGNFSVV
jgi:hypothetical protein